MYQTVKELHIALDQSLQAINSNRLGVIKEQEKDWLLNETQFRLIDIIIDPRKRAGYEDDQVTYDMLLPVKKDVVLPVYNIDDTRGYAILPADYIHRDSINANVVFNCDRLRTDSIIDITNRYVTLDLLNISAPYFSNFKITVNGIVFDATANNYASFNRLDALFMLVNTVIDFYRNNDIEVYWERYADVYKQNTFYFIGKNGSPINTAIIEYNGLTLASTILVKSRNTINTNNFTVLNNQPTSLESTEYIDDMLQHLFFTTVPNKPLITISDYLIMVYYTSDWFISSIKLRYIKRPTLINSVTGSMTELKNISDKIIQFTVQNIKAKIGDTSYQAIVNENLVTN